MKASSTFTVSIYRNGEWIEVGHPVSFEGADKSVALLRRLGHRDIKTNRKVGKKNYTNTYHYETRK